ncbi:MAG: alpha/beta hydrolase [Deinococcota bacterium]|nr:alpha/beta hydrolase [Deinococcota bacterium]
MLRVTERAHVFKRVGGAALELRLYEPVGPRTGGAVVFFCGGGWLNGDLEQFAPQSRHFAARGMVAACAEYRVRNRHGATPFDGLADARAAIRWLRERAERLGFDADRLVAAGGSAGGHLAACTAIIEDAESPPSARPDALVLFNPVLDTSPTGFGHERFGGRGHELSPLHHLGPDLPPTLILQGEDDETTPLRTAAAFTKRMRETGNSCKLVSFAGEGHGFFNPGRGEGRTFTATLRHADTFLGALGYLSPRPVNSKGAPQP